MLNYFQPEGRGRDEDFSSRYFGSVSEPRPPNGFSPWVRPFPPRLPPGVASPLFSRIPASPAGSTSPCPSGFSAILTKPSNRSEPP